MKHREDIARGLGEYRQSQEIPGEPLDDVACEGNLPIETINSEVLPTVESEISTAGSEAPYIDGSFDAGLSSFLERVERLIEGKASRSSFL